MRCHLVQLLQWDQYDAVLRLYLLCYPKLVESKASINLIVHSYIGSVEPISVVFTASIHLAPEPLLQHVKTLMVKHAYLLSAEHSALVCLILVSVRHLGLWMELQDALRPSFTHVCWVGTWLPWHPSLTVHNNMTRAQYYRLKCE